LQYTRLFVIFFVVFGSFSDPIFFANYGQASAQKIDYATSGIRFRLVASIKADPKYAKQNYDGAIGSLAAMVRISAHATESQFFGVAFDKASDFSVVNGSAEQMIWEETKCHQRRGLPKETVMSMDGSIATDKAKTNIHARVRHIGLPLPSDEITQGRRLPAGVDNTGPFIAYRSQTVMSHLFVDVKIYTFNCELRRG
jgi:hypothetical protein